MYNKKEHYIISINDAVKTINKCIKLTNSKKLSEDKYYLDMIKEKKITKNINEYGIEILFDTEEKNDDKILLGGTEMNDNILDYNNILDYDNIIFVNKIYNTILNLF